MRKLRYFRIRVMRLTATPHSIAAGLAAGIAMSWTPFLGFHLVFALGLAYLLSGNMVAAALGTTLSNPATFPFIGALTWETGKWILGQQGETGASVDLVALFEKLEFSQLWAPVLKPMLVGAVPFMAVTGLSIYLLTLSGVRGFQERRRLRLVERARLRLPAILDEVGSV